MALILNIETSTHICSVCLAKDGDVITYEESHQPNAHSTLLSVFIERILNRSSYKLGDLEAISISKGPGSYTGLRIGVSVAKGIAYALNIPLVSISTLEHMVVGARKSASAQKALYTPLLDARRMEVFTALFDVNLQCVVGPHTINIDDILFSSYLSHRTVYFFGGGMPKVRSVLQDQIGAIFLDNFQNSSIDMVSLSEAAFTNKDFEDLAYFSPMYLKEFIPNRNKKPG